MDDFIPLSTHADISSNRSSPRVGKIAPALITSLRAPWLDTEEDSFALSLPPFVRFHNEIIKFCDFSSPSRLELNDRRKAFEDVRSCILELFPTANVDIFGSHLTGIITPSSDIDLAMLNVPIKPGDELDPLFSLATLLKQRGLASYCEVISNAKVPIIKLDHLSTAIPVDICCNNTSGFDTGQLMREFAQSFPPMRPLTMILKVFLAQRRYNDTYTGGIGSFLLCGMIVSFLQMRKREEHTSGRSRTWNLAVLLLDFFSLYGCNFNYARTGISLNDDGCYFNKIKRGPEWFNPNRPTLLCFENPAVPDTDLGRSSYLMPKIKRSFEHAHQLLSAALVDISLESYLSYVIRSDDPLLSNRDVPVLGAARYNQFQSLAGLEEKKVEASPSKKRRR